MSRSSEILVRYGPWRYEGFASEVLGIVLTPEGIVKGRNPLHSQLIQNRWLQNSEVGEIAKQYPLPPTGERGLDERPRFLNAVVNTRERKQFKRDCRDFSFYIYIQVIL